MTPSPTNTLPCCPSLTKQGNFIELKRGFLDPFHNLTIKTIIWHEPNFIVYLDDTLDYFWCSLDDDKCTSEEMRILDLRLTALSAIPIKHLKPADREHINCTIGKGVAELLGCDDTASERKKALATAMKNFDAAEAYAIQRNFEYSRNWYFLSSIAILAGAIFLLAIGYLIAGPTSKVSQVCQYVFAGALGTLLFITIRISNRKDGTLLLDSSASKGNHFVVALAKMFTGMIGAIAVGYGIEAGLIVPKAREMGTTLVSTEGISPMVFLLCMAAGLSERLVPSVIGQVSIGAVSAVGHKRHL